MPLRRSPHCGGILSAAADSCPHCGRPMKWRAQASSGPSRRHREPSAWRSFKALCVAFGGVVLASSAISFATLHMTTLVQAPHKRPNFAVSRGIYTLRIRNQGSPELVGRTMEVSINGDVLGYRATSTVPTVGDSVTIPLRELVNGDERLQSREPSGHGCPGRHPHGQTGI